MSFYTTRTEYDNVLIHNLNLINDWSVFGSVAFRTATSPDRIKLLFYKLMREVERGHRGQYIVRFEGDNVVRNRHFHFLLCNNGLINGLDNVADVKIALQKAINKLADKHEYNRYSINDQTVEQGNRLYPEFTTATTDFREYNPHHPFGDAIEYISKVATNEREDLSARGLDSAVRGLNWKLSRAIKRRITEINLNRVPETYCLHHRGRD